MIAKIIAESLRRLADLIAPAQRPAFARDLINATRRIEGLLDHATTVALLRLEKKMDRGLYDLTFLKRQGGVYVGDGIALTHLADETPIFTNSNDYGPPVNFLIGGRYEPENHDLLMSFLKPGGTVLDIGANVGFYTLAFAKRLRPPGRVIAFEPHPLLAELVRRNVHINGLRDVVEVHQCGLSDAPRTETFHFPPGHLGGGRVGAGPADGGSEHIAQLARLDDILPDGTAIDIAKIDVEGHELPVLAGMVRTIRQSPDLVILMEKFVVDDGREAAILDFLHSVGMQAYRVGDGELTGPMLLDDLRALRGHLLAARPATCTPLQRSFFTLYPSQLYTPRPAGEPGVYTGSEAEVLFFGPYWVLPKGTWTLEMKGEITGEITLAITENRGAVVAELPFDNVTSSRAFTIDHELVNFECLARVKSPSASVALERIILTRTG